MPSVTASAPGKIILFGEHAVVYGRPAIAVPVTQVRAKAIVSAEPLAPTGQVRLTARDTGLKCLLSELPGHHPLALAISGVQRALGVERLPALHLRIESEIPIAAGLGSGAAVSAAIARALSAFLGSPLADEQVSEIAFQVDRKHHGTPSGIDNTVIAYAQPIFFISGQPFERLQPAQPLTLVIGNTGAASPTRAVVGDVRRRWTEDPAPVERVLDAIGALVVEARRALESGPANALGSLLTRNHALLQELDVSSPALDRLVQAALEAGAGGAKLCGGGRGGNMIALVAPEQAESVASALRATGASGVLTTTVA